jgi:hypothetical protein
MALTYRDEQSSALTNTQIDNNFRYFTGSYSVTGSLTSSVGFYGNVTIPDVLTFNATTIIPSVSGGMFYSSSGIFYNQSGSQYLPFASSL